MKATKLRKLIADLQRLEAAFEPGSRLRVVHHAAAALPTGYSALAAAKAVGMRSQNLCDTPHRPRGACSLRDNAYALSVTFAARRVAYFMTERAPMLMPKNSELRGIA